MIVVDASVLATALGDDGKDGDSARERLLGQELAAPEIIDLEVMSVWRRTLGEERLAALALADLADLALRRAPHLALLPRCWELVIPDAKDPASAIERLIRHPPTAIRDALATEDPAHVH